MNSPHTSTTDLHLAIVLADPRLENPYHASEFQKEHDQLDVTHLREAMDSLFDGGQVTYLEDHDRLLDELRVCNADLVLNFCNAGFRNEPSLHMHVPALLEMLGLPFAGADATCLALCHDKSGVNAAGARLGIPVPRQTLLGPGVVDGDLGSGYPMVLKPNGASGSQGITTESVVHDAEQASQRVGELADMGITRVVAEEFLDGREFSVAVLGGVEEGQPPTCLPPLEIDYGQLPDDLPRIMTHESKADQESVYWNQVFLRPAELSTSARQQVEDASARMFERLGCRDYARFDFRSDAEGVPRLIDANAHPEWGAEGMMAHMASFADLSYEDLLVHIIRTAHGRALEHPPTRPQGASMRPVVAARGIHLRPTQAQDVPFVREVESAPDNRDHIEQWSADEHLFSLTAGRYEHLIIEDQDGDRVGYVVLEGFDDPEDAMLLRRIVVARKGEGIGDRAMEAIERYCFHAYGFDRLWLEVHADNEPARRLYRRHGFKEEEESGSIRMGLAARELAGSGSRSAASHGG